MDLNDRGVSTSVGDFDNRGKIRSRLWEIWILKERKGEKIR